MTREELIGALCDRFCPDFATRMADRVEAAGACDLLYELATATAEELTRAQRHAVAFHAAYTLERIYFRSPQRFLPHRERFCTRDFAAATDPSARRCFGKMMAHLLTEYDPGRAALDGIASAAADWLIDPRTKVAVRIRAMEVLGACRERLPWVAESWGDLMTAATADVTPAVASRMRRGWSSGRRTTSQRTATRRTATRRAAALK